MVRIHPIGWTVRSLGAGASDEDGYSGIQTSINPTSRIPQISKGYVNYGTTPQVVRYFKSGTTLIRRVNNVDTPIATDVEDFELTFPPAGNDQVVNISVTFIPRYRLSGSRDAARAGTRAEARILLRNKRTGATVPST